MRNLLPKELKIKFIDPLLGLRGFTYSEGNPFLIKIDTKEFIIFLKNLSPAYFKTSPDATRIQLPLIKGFSNSLKTDLPFVVLGYDVDSDVFVSWDPMKIKERLNARKNVSLYSRASLQNEVQSDEFKIAYLITGEKIILFKRELMVSFFDKLQLLFGDRDNTPTTIDSSHSKTSQGSQILTLSEINDEELIQKIELLLKKNKVLEAVEVCMQSSKSEFKELSFKEWFQLVKEYYQRMN